MAGTEVITDTKAKSGDRGGSGSGTHTPPRAGRSGRRVRQKGRRSKRSARNTLQASGRFRQDHSRNGRKERRRCKDAHRRQDRNARRTAGGRCEEPQDRQSHGLGQHERRKVDHGKLPLRHARRSSPAQRTIQNERHGTTRLSRQSFRNVGRKEQLARRCG